MNGRKLRRCVEAGSHTWFSPENLLAVSNLDARPTKDPRAHFRCFVRGDMLELGLANPGLAGNEERSTVRPCPSPEGPEPVNLRVAPNEATDWRAAAGRSSGCRTRVSSMGRCLEPDLTDLRHSVYRRHPAGKQGRSGALWSSTCRR